MSPWLFICCMVYAYSALVGCLITYFGIALSVVLCESLNKRSDGQKIHSLDTGP